jgi:hypothetical protein
VEHANDLKLWVWEIHICTIDACPVI